MYMSEVAATAIVQPTMPRLLSDRLRANRGKRSANTVGSRRGERAVGGRALLAQRERRGRGGGSVQREHGLLQVGFGDDEAGHRAPGGRLDQRVDGTVDR